MNETERVEAVAKAIYDLDPDYERDYDDSINILEWDIVGYTMDADNYREQAAAAIAALDIEQIERAAYERAFRDAYKRAFRDAYKRAFRDVYEIVDDSASPSEALLRLEEVIQKGQADE